MGPHPQLPFLYFLRQNFAYAAQAGSELIILLPEFLNAEIVGVCHYTWLHTVFLRCMYFYFLCMSALPVCVCVHHRHT